MGNFSNAPFILGIFDNVTCITTSSSSNDKLVVNSLANLQIVIQT